MAAVDDIDDLIERYHLALGEFMKGNTEPAYVVEVEHLEAKVHGGQEITPYALRVTMIFGPEEGAWRVAHRHADQITPPLASRVGDTRVELALRCPSQNAVSGRSSQKKPSKTLGE